jgi:hypothetical protein
VLPDAVQQQKADERRLRTRRMLRRLRRAIRRWAWGPSPTLPAARLDLVVTGQLSTTDLWTAWRLADLECGLELTAWGLASSRSRGRARTLYRKALAREAALAAALAERYRADASAAG